MSRFTDKVVVVTGAGSGMGAATAKAFVNEGAKVVLVGRTEEKLKKVAAELPAEQVLIAPTDIADSHAVSALAAHVEQKWGDVDILVNNAGVVVQGLAHELSVDDWDKQMGTNLNGVFYMVRAFVPGILKQKGNIVNISSVSGLGGDWGMSFYNASKGAISNFTRSLAMDYGQHGVRVNAVCPGMTETEMTAGITSDTQALDKFKDRTPLQRPGQSEDIAHAVLFLASDQASYITGVNLPVDGGIHASNGQPRQA
ncbi:SDR family oxidoreductase [Rosenbergiella epipactidis]|uniref:SDR family NAD(P)-dependent oxidoreductase n=1 Tax=Rosenbergiella epipactidis TaxID=1544694 RepID=UPI002027682C|nr:SDR family oxidoreductase [Rosenbergiella epipactidis]MCL9667732.1 SDR family oxidoreductase [Rosenbergiella epipactidis]